MSGPGGLVAVELVRAQAGVVVELSESLKSSSHVVGAFHQISGRNTA